jgi:hypothetical protein
MIATFKTTFVFSIILFFSLQVNANPPNRFQKVAQEFNIHPYNLENGYPIRYKWDEKPVRGIIYLSNEIPYLEKLDARTYAGQPTLENAKIIANFSAEPVDIAKYYLIVDSTVVQRDLSEFIDELMDNEVFMHVCFVGSNGKYVNVRYEDYTAGCNDMIRAYFYRNVLQIMINSRDNLIVEGKWMEIDSVHRAAFNFYYSNISQSDQDINQMNYTIVDINHCHTELNKVESMLEDVPENTFLIHERGELLKILELSNNFKKIFKPSKTSFVQLKKQYGTSLKTWYNVIDQVQLGVFLARQEYAKERFGLSYLELFYGRNIKHLALLEMTFPDLMKITYDAELPPPPPLEIEIIDPITEPPHEIDGEYKIEDSLQSEMLIDSL